MKKIYKKTPEKLNQIMEFIVEFNSKNGYCPSIREIAKRLEITTPSLVKYYLDMLEKNGLILRGDAPRRIITLPTNKSDDLSSLNLDFDNSSSVFNCPVVGSVAAGVPILAMENIMGYYPLPSSEYRTDCTYMLKVVGDSMVEIGIDDGDIIIVDKSKEPLNAKIVVAMIDDSVTVKRFFKESDKIILHPENKNYDDIIVTKGTPLMILGVVVGLIKKF